MSEFDRDDTDSTAREARLTGQRMDEIRDAEWSAKRRDDESLRSSLERETESLDDPPEKVSLDDKPYDRFARQADIRDDLGKAVDTAFFNSSLGEKREKEQAAFDLIGKKMQRRYGMSGVDGTKQLMNALNQLETQPEQALQFLYREYVEGGAAEQAHQRDFSASIKDIEAVEKKYDVPQEVWSLVPDYMATAEFQRTITGDNQADILRAVRMVKKGLDRVKMR